MSPLKCLELMTSYAPPYALRVITVNFGTEASAYANRSWADSVGGGGVGEGGSFVAKNCKHVHTYSVINDVT